MLDSERMMEADERPSQLVWFDTTGAGRGDLQLQADFGPCNYERTMTLNAVSAQLRQERSPGAAPSPMQGVMEVQLAKQQADQAFTACMNNRGWVLGQQTMQ